MSVNDDPCCCPASWGQHQSNYQIGALKLLCDIATNTAGGGGGGVFDIEYFICDNGVQKLVRICGSSCDSPTVTYLLPNRTASTAPADWNLVTIGACTAATNVTLARSTVTNTSSVTAGKYRVTIKNVGNDAGTVLGAALVPTEIYTVEGFYDEATKQMKKLGAIAYDATGTTFRIETIE